MNWILKANIIICWLLFKNVMAQDKKPIAIYGYISHVEEDGTPLKNDRRYLECNLYLHDNYSFKYIF